MSGTARFHDKLHRANHHTAPTSGLPDSSYDPIASPDNPFRGDFVLSGSLSSQYAGIFNDLVVKNNSVLGSSTGTTTITGNVNIGGPNSTNTIAGSANTITGPVTMSAGSLFSAPSGTFVQLSVLSSAQIQQKLGIGGVVPQYTLHVVGDVRVEGNLSASGNSSFQNTLFSTTSALSVVNTGTGAAIVISQLGNQPIAAFYDGSDPAMWIDGSNTRPGWIGVKTNTPTCEFTVNGSVSASGTATFDQLNISNGNFTALNVGSLGATSTNIVTDNVTTANITTANITTGNITTANITTGNITTVTSTTLGANTANITTANIITDNVTTANITTVNAGTVNATGNISTTNGGIVTLNGNIVTTNGRFISGGIDLAQLIGAGGSGGGGGSTSLSGLVDINISNPTDLQSLVYLANQGKWINATINSGSGGGGGLTNPVVGTLSASDINLTSALVQTFSVPLTASGDFLVLNINGTNRKIRLWD